MNNTDIGAVKGLNNPEFLTPNKLPVAIPKVRKRQLRIYPKGRMYFFSLLMETLGISKGGKVRIVFDKNTYGDRTDCYIYQSIHEDSFSVESKRGGSGLLYSKALCKMLADHFGGFGEEKSIVLDVLPKVTKHNSLRLFKIRRRPCLK